MRRNNGYFGFASIILVVVFWLLALSASSQAQISIRAKEETHIGSCTFPANNRLGILVSYTGTPPASLKVLYSDGSNAQNFSSINWQGKTEVEIQPDRLQDSYTGTFLVEATVGGLTYESAPLYAAICVGGQGNGRVSAVGGGGMNDRVNPFASPSSGRNCPLTSKVDAVITLNATTLRPLTVKYWFEKSGSPLIAVNGAPTIVAPWQLTFKPGQSQKAIKQTVWKLGAAGASSASANLTVKVAIPQRLGKAKIIETKPPLLLTCGPIK